MTEDERFDLCTNTDQFNKREDIEVDKIRSMMALALNDLAYTQIREPKADMKKECSTVFKLHYDCLRELSEAYLMFDRIKVSSHECLFVYLCVRYKELELDLNFFDKIRTARNGIQYYGTPIDMDYWAKNKVQLNLYIQTIKKAIETRLKEIK